MPDELETLKAKVENLEQEVYKYKSTSLQSITNFFDVSRGNLQFPKRDALPATCRVGEVVEVNGVFYQCVAQDTWNETGGNYVGTAGEAIDTSSASKFVYLKASDSKFYMVDSDADESTWKFVGVVARGQNVGANASVRVTFTGIAGGFSGLTAGDRLYPSATAGTAGTTPVASQAVELGFAVSATEVFIMPRSPHLVAGSDSSGASTSDEIRTVTIGFRPRVIFYLARQSNQAGEVNTGFGFWNDGSHYSVLINDGVAAQLVQDTSFVSQYNGGSASTSIEITIETITATGFNINYNRVNVDANTATATVYYLAIA